ncbi:ribonuclease H-like domain-containing protein [Tanacetum coccineum]|uniref:Ribonuclease H-like domain-containing protein n=1 Tax=Tanacetum coccineum TaxID=301880 RepID=A0ABQ5DTW2_9ASTR
MTHPSPKRNMVPKAVLMKSGLVSLTTARPVNTAQPRTTVNSARPMTNIFNKAHSTVRRPINIKTETKNSNFNQMVNPVKAKNVNTAKPKAVVNAARPKAVLKAVKGNQVNAVKASAYWVWKPKTKVIDYGNPRQDLKEKGMIDSGCSRHMTGNMSYLTDFEEIDGGYVAFGGSPKGGKITANGTIKTGNLDFEDVYFARELKFNLLSVSQMCDKKNSVLFNDTECIILSPNFKLTDESHVLLKVPRKDYMYSVDLKNIVPKGGLTCLFAKATSDEYKLWHRRLGHINFKTMNKLVKRNLVRVVTVDYSRFKGLRLLGCGLMKTEFQEYSEMNQFCKRKGIKREFSVARNPQQNEVAERKNRTLIEAARTMLCKARMETVPSKDYILPPLWTANLPFSQSSKSSPDVGFKPSGDDEKKVTEEPGKEGGDPSKEGEKDNQEKDVNVNSTNIVNAASTNEVNAVGAKTSIEFLDDLNMPELEDIVYSGDDGDVGVEADMNNLDAFMPVSPIPTTRVHKDHLVEQIIGDLNSAPQTSRMIKNLGEHGRTQKGNSCFEGSKLDIGYAGRASTIQVKRSLDFEGIDYDEVFALVARIEAIRLFLAYALFKDFVVYQMDVKSAFLYGKIKDEVYVCQPLGFEDPDFPDRVYKVEKELYGLHQAPRACTPMETQKLLLKDEDGEEVDVHVYRSMINSLMYLTSSRPNIMFAVCAQVKQKEDGIFISQDKYVTEILKKFGFTDVKTASTPMETQKPLLKDSNEKKLIQMIKIHTYKNVVDLLTKAFDCYQDSKTASTASTPMETQKPLLKDEDGEERIGVNAGNSRLMLLGINLLLLMKVNAARHHLLLLMKVNAVRHNLLLPVQVNTIEEKPAECEGFKQIVDFLNANPIKYELTVNPTIYTSCIEQFLATAKAKIVNGEEQLQALVDRKKVIITESTIRRDLQLEDAEGIDCLPNAATFEQLKLMGYEKLSQKLTFYKAFFSPQWKYLIHTILQCLSAKTTAWNEFSSTIAFAIICLAINQKFNFSKYIFDNMVKNGDSMEEMGEGSANPHHTPIITQPSTSQPQKKQKLRKPKRKDTGIPQSSSPTEPIADEAVNEEDVPTHSNDPLLSGEDRLKLDELTTLCTNLQSRVGLSAKVVSSKDEGLGEEDTSKQERKIHNIDADKDITMDSTHFDTDPDTFGVHDLDGDEVFIETEEPVVNVATTTSTISVSVAKDLSDVDMTLAQALAELKNTKPKVVTTAATTTTTAVTRPKAKGLVIQEQEQASTPITSSKDKGKGIMVEEPLKMKKKKIILLINMKI